MNEGSRKTVLYVDDEEVNLFLFEKRFGKKINVMTSTSGTEALKMLEDNADSIDVVISDMRMPEMSGIEFITSAKGSFENIQYYILTGYEYSPELEAARNSNLITNLFTKPLDFDQISEAIEAA